MDLSQREKEMESKRKRCIGESTSRLKHIRSTVWDRGGEKGNMELKCFFKSDAIVTKNKRA